MICLLLPLAVGGLAALCTSDSMKIYPALNKPPLSPPGWLFPVVWTVLFLLMGIASFLVLRTGQPRAIGSALRVYGVQLLVNFFWPILFFNLQAYLFSFLWLVLLWLLIGVTLFLFYRLSRPAGMLLAPYLLWVTFAGYLNLSVYLLN